jgi:hypothetical protein
LRADKTSFDYDEAITFSWKTINADKVTIQPFGSVKPIDTKTYKIKDFKQSEVKFELIEENLNTGRQTKASLNLKNKTYQELYIYFKTIIISENSRRTNGGDTGSKTNKPKTVSKQIRTNQTDKGEIKIELTFGKVIPLTNNKVYQNDSPASDGKYKLDFMHYIIVKNGIIIDLTCF